MGSALTFEERCLLAVADRFESASKGVQCQEEAADWPQWLAALFPASVRFPMAERHIRLWQWAAAVRQGESPRPFVAVWPRGSGKSTTAELVATYLGARGLKRYVLYIRSTQDDADDSVTNIAGRFESEAFAATYRAHAERQLSKYGASKGWRRNRIRTSGGLTIDALGFDTAMRGKKIDDQRPDLIIIDDVDQEEDTPRITDKKLRALTKKILPAGAADCATLVIQNLIIPDGVVSRICSGKADCLSRAIIDGPHQAVEGLKIERRWDDEMKRNRAIIVGGVPTWVGQDLAACQRDIDDFGFTAFDQECQQNVAVRPGAMWTPALLEDIRYLGEIPPLRERAVAVDPSGGAAEVGIWGGGVGYDGIAYLFLDASRPYDWAGERWPVTVDNACEEVGTDDVAVEWNFNGRECKEALKVVNPALKVHRVDATRGKRIRARPAAELCAEGRVRLCGHFPETESELTSWVEGDVSPNRMDAFVLLLFRLVIHKMKRGSGQTGFRVPKAELAKASRWSGLRVPR